MIQATTSLTRAAPEQAALGNRQFRNKNGHSPAGQFAGQDASQCGVGHMALPARSGPLTTQY